MLSGADTGTPSFTAPLLAGGLGGPQTLTFRVTVSDGALTDTADVKVIVEQVNHAPTADAGTAQTVHPGRTVTLSGNGSTDPDGDPLSFGWMQVSGPAVTLGGSDTATASFVAPPVSGTVDLTFRLTASDTQLSDSKEVTITVKNGPPVCSVARPTVSRLWPPSHGLIEAGIIGLTDPDDATVQVRITGVTQDEPVNGLGDGDTAPDAVIQGDKVLLRAERSGTGNGRVYVVGFIADDGLGGTCSGSVNVTVPHSLKSGADAIDDGQLHDSTQP